MAHREDVPLQAGDRTEDRHPGIALDRLGDQQALPLGGDLVENDAADIETLVEFQTAEDHRRHGAGGLGAVDHQQDRQTQGNGQVGGGIAAVGGHAVIEPAVALENHHVGPPGMPLQGTVQGLVAHQKGIEIVAAAAGRQLQPAGIDIVGPLLEGHHHSALAGEGRGQTDRDHALSRAPGKSGHHQSFWHSSFVFVESGLSYSRRSGWPVQCSSRPCSRQALLYSSLSRCSSCRRYSSIPSAFRSGGTKRGSP